ncbi:MAG: metallophosphoesterase [Pirellulaceae bacterium]
MSNLPESAAEPPAVREMTRVVWLTDIHLNFLDDQAIDAFLQSVRENSPAAVLISGDIGEAHHLEAHLERIDQSLDADVYFVLGNHDFYFGSIAGVRRIAQDVCRRRPRLHYLTESAWFPLSSEVGLVGHDGWADARIGDYEHSLVMMNDYKLIDELAGVNKMQRWPLLHALGDAAAAHIRRVLPEALARFPHVVLLTHVPPWREACWHEGQISDDEWAPHFTCQAMGEAILEVMESRADQELTVLCGHTHGDGETRPLANVHCITGGAEYGAPRITRVLDL